MNKSEIIKTYFDRSSALKITEARYKKSVMSLFNFLLSYDEVTRDKTGSLINNNQTVTATIRANAEGIIAGTEEISFFFGKKNLDIAILVKDGKVVEKETPILKLRGTATDILRFERTILNILQRMSGIASVVYTLIRITNASAKIAGTRKTLWGLLDKKAIAVGGGLTHRLSLADGLLIKDNHLDMVSENRLQAIQTVIEKSKGELLELEIDSYKEAIFSADLWEKFYPKNPLILMLDNFSVQLARQTITELEGKNVIVELSGGITKSNIKDYAFLGADVISLGALTHSAHALDMSLHFG